MRTRNVELIIYDKEVLYEKLDYLSNFCGEYAYILHDKDKDDNGELKKPHYHLRIFGVNQKSITAWADFLNVKENEIQVLENKRRAIRYLIHLDSPNKYQYNSLDIVSNIYGIDDYFTQDKQEETTQLQNIFAYIDEIKGYIYFSEIKSYVIQNNYWSSYRRYYSIIKDVIIEHNRYCIDYMLK